MERAETMAGLKAAIKLLLKRQGSQYVELAQSLGTSVPTIKRCLTNGELSLSRLLEICAFLGVTLGELEGVAKDHAGAQKTFFTEEQEIFFVSEPRYLTYLLSLYDGMTPAAIAKRWQLSAASTDKYLRKLEQMALIKVSPKGRVAPTSANPPEWMANGPLVRANLELLLDKVSGFFRGPIIDRYRQGNVADGTRLALFTARISKKFYMNWREQMGKLIEDLRRASDYECKFVDASNLETVVVMSASALLPSDDPEVEALGQVLGRIGDL